MTEEHHTYMWAPIMGLSTGILGLGIHSFVLNEVMLGFVYSIFFLGIFIAFIYSELHSRKKADFGVFHDESHITANIQKNTWIWVFLASEVMFFGLLIALSFSLRIAVESGLSDGYFGHIQNLYSSGGQIFNGWGAYIDGEFKNPREIFREGSAVIIVSINTFILICSSFTMVWAHEAAEKGEWKEARNRLFYTALIGTIFLSVQIYEYSKLISEGFTPESGLLGSTFFIQTGFHGAHVLAGVLLILAMAYKAHIGGMKDASDVENIGLYWHFVDVVWVLLFTLVYLV